jgi:orotate phosphoribosyltransferase
VLIALDRMERSGKDGALSPNSAVQEVAREFGIPVISIANLDDLFGYLSAHANDPQLAQFTEKVAAYRARYGVQAAA